MKHIILCPNPVRDHGLAYTETLRQKLEARGLSPQVYPLDYMVEDRMAPLGAVPEALRTAIRGADLLVTLGGDGTILHLAPLAAPYGVPILTVNLGRKGFIAELECKDLDKLVEIAAGESYRVQERMMLDVTVERGDAVVYEGFALNDMVAHGIARMVDIEVHGDAQLITRFSGDGIIVNTPTGSTAYSMAAGGPIIEPTVRALSVTPVCAHALYAKSFVLSPDRVVTIGITLTGGKRGYLSVDGSSFNLEDGDQIRVTESRHVTRLVKCAERSFYQIVSEKLGEGVDQR